MQPVPRIEMDILTATNMTEKEKMLAGLVYDACNQELLDDLQACKDILWRYNHLTPSSHTEELRRLVRQLLGSCGDDVTILQPFYCDYGKNIRLGDHIYINFHCTILDEALVTIGDNAFIGPNVSIYTACHSTNPVERNTREEWAKPVTIGNNCWIAGSVTILPGVTIGDNTTIGAGSVVVHDIPANSVAVGNPCRVISQV